MMTMVNHMKEQHLYIWVRQADFASTASTTLDRKIKQVHILVISVSTAGDVNGDGYSDVIVGADGNDAGGSLAGRSYIYFGGA